MKLTRERLLRGAFHVTILGLIAYLIFGFARPSPATVALDNQTYRITGPYAHENLAVYLIHADTQDDRTFITLDEGLKSGVVKVSEKSNAQVNELTIENTGEDHLFLQEGDRVKGGQQDRTIYTSLIVKPHSGKLPLPAYCVEPHRWVAGAQGGKFGGTANPAVCPKEVRLAAKVQKDQGQVWAAVAQQKQVCVVNGLSGNTNSSLNESLDAPKVKRIADEFARALNGVIEGQDDAVGVVIAINGQVEEVNFYLNRQLLAKQFPRLVQSYSLEATLKQKESAKARTLSEVEVGRFVWASDQGEKKAALAVAKAGPQVVQPQGEMAAQVLGAQIVTQQFQTLGQANAPVQQAAIVYSNSISRPFVPVNNVPRYLLPQGASHSQARSYGTASPLSNDPAVSQVAMPRNVRRTEAVNQDNQVQVFEQAAVVNCKTMYQGKLVHRQYLSRKLPVTHRPVRGAQSNANDIAPRLMNDEVGNMEIQVTPNAPPPQGSNPPRGNR